MFSIILLKSAARLTPGLQIGLSNVLLYVASDFVMESREIRPLPIFNAFIAIFHIPVTKVKKIKWSRYRPGVAQRVGRGIALLFQDRGTRRGWVVSSTPRPHFTPGKDRVPILQEVGWAPGPVWTDGKSRPSIYLLLSKTHIRVTLKMFTKLTRSGYEYVICFSGHMFRLESYVFDVFRLNLITREAFIFGELPKSKNNLILRGFKWLPFNLVSGSAIVLIEPSDLHTDITMKEHHPYYQSLLCANAWTARQYLLPNSATYTHQQGHDQYM